MRLKTNTMAVSLILLAACAPTGATYRTASSNTSDQNSAMPPARPSSAANLKVCAPANSLLGLDVSDYDPGTNWPEVRQAGAGFAFVKATEGINFINSVFKGDWTATKAAGVLRGAYHFFHPGDDPTTQANFFLKTLNAGGSATDLPAMLDWEVSDGVSAIQQIKNAQIWLDIVEAATGKTPIIYVDPSYWNGLGNPTGFQRYPLFIANYEVSCPSVPPPWSTWTFWQRGSGSINGVKTADADLDLFSGSLAMLSQFF